MHHTTRPSVRASFLTAYASSVRPGFFSLRDRHLNATAVAPSYSSARHMNIITPYHHTVKVQAMQTKLQQKFQTTTNATSTTTTRALQSSSSSSSISSTSSTLHRHTLASFRLLPSKSTGAAATIAELRTQLRLKSTAARTTFGQGAIVQPKKTIWERVKKEFHHYWDGTKLLGKEIKISTKLATSLLYGNKLTRREQRQLRRTTGDLLRLIPFSVFIIVPFMEFLLPVFLKFFPNMLPSTFEDSHAEEEKKRKMIKMRLEMAKFLQDTVEESGGAPGSERAQAAKEFGDFFRKLRTTGDQASTEELLRVARLFNDGLTLENLTRPQLVCMCRYMNLNTFGTDNLLRYQIQTRMNSIKCDDQMIMAEGVDSLTVRELQAACQHRGIHTGGSSMPRLRSELSQWLELHLTYAIPSSLLILSRAFSYSDFDLAAPNAVPVEALQAALSALPDNLVHEAELQAAAAIQEEEEEATPKHKLQVLELQEELIKDEKAQREMIENIRKTVDEGAKMMKDGQVAAATAVSLNPHLHLSPPSSVSSSENILPPFRWTESQDKAILTEREMRELREVLWNKSAQFAEQNPEELDEEPLEYIEMGDGEVPTTLERPHGP